MKMQKASEKHNEFMKRKEIMFEIDHSSEATPTKASLQHLIAKEYNKDVTHVDIRSIFSRHGMHVSDAKVFVWDEKKVKDLAIKEAPKDNNAEQKTEKKAESPKKEEAKK